jgi:hypothetical protein
MSHEELSQTMKDIEKYLSISRYDLGSSLDPDEVGRLETELFKYFLEKDIDTIYVLYTTAIFPYNNEKALNISFSDENSFNLFSSKWGSKISDVTGISINRKTSSLSTGNKPQSLSVIFFGRSLSNLYELLNMELDHDYINS